jgi:hypothetical protein
MAQMDVPVMKLQARLYRQIGEFIFRYAQLEYQLHEIVWALAKMEYKMGRIMTVGTDSRVVRRQIDTILSTPKWIKDASLIADIRKLAKIADNQYANRNHLAHGTWQAPYRSTSRNKPRLHKMFSPEERLMPREYKGVDAARIKEWVAKLRTANLLARKVIRRFNDALPSSQRRYA